MESMNGGPSEAERHTPNTSPAHRPWTVVQWVFVAGALLVCALGLSTASPRWLLALGLATASVMVYAAAQRRRAARWAWYALALAAMLFTVADFLSLHNPNEPGRIIVGLYLPAYILAGAAFWRMIALAPVRRRGMLDVLVLAAGLALLLLRLVFAGGMRTMQWDNAVRMVFPLADLMLVVLSIRLVSVWRMASTLLLAAGTLFLLGLAIQVITVGYGASPSALLVLRTGELTCWALASMTAPVHPARAHSARRAHPGMPFWPLATVVLLPPVALLAHGTFVGDGRSVAIAAACGVTALFILARLRVEGRVGHLSDPVTGLVTLQGLHDATATALSGAAAAGRTVAVFFIDIAAFHTINDTLGTPAGDEVLSVVAKRADAAADPVRTTARLNGDRFAVLNSAADPARIEQQAARIQTAIAEPMDIAARSLTLATYVGVATSRYADDPDELLGNADLALHSAKARGPGHVVRYEPGLRSALAEPARLRGELPAAIRLGQMVLEYQPIVELATSRIDGFEALVRWHHPELGKLGPDRFIHVAESAGCIDDLGADVLHQALRGTSRLNRAAERPIFVDINVSPLQLGNGDRLVAILESGLAETSLDPALVVLELTESGLGVTATPVEGVLDRLRRTGVRLALDDFGTGYSSLARLRDLPFDTVKIDKSFVSDLRAGRPLELIMGIVGIARTMELTVVAEGVETEDVKQLLIEAECEYGQGYFFSRPIPLDAAADLFEH